jgi:hypothetical protein
MPALTATRRGRIARVARLALPTAAGLAVGTLQLAALRAAGLNGTAPDGADAFKGMISTLTSNWEWLIATGIGLALMIVAGLMIFGSQRAPEHAFRIAGGIMLILVVIPAILA